MQSAAAWQQHWCGGISLGEQHRSWQVCSIIALSFLGLLPPPSRAVLAAQLQPSPALEAHIFPTAGTTSAFPSTLITEGCSCAAKVLGSNLINNLLPSLPCVVPPNPVITSAKLLWPQSARW